MISYNVDNGVVPDFITQDHDSELEKINEMFGIDEDTIISHVKGEK